MEHAVSLIAVTQRKKANLIHLDILQITHQTPTAHSSSLQRPMSKSQLFSITLKSEPIMQTPQGELMGKEKF